VAASLNTQTCEAVSLHTTKARGVELGFRSFFTLAVEGLPTRLLNLKEERARYPLGTRLDEPQSQSGLFRDEMSCLYQKLNHDSSVFQLAATCQLKFLTLNILSTRFLNIRTANLLLFGSEKFSLVHKQNCTKLVLKL
jgi:hypothetical protein